MKTLKLVGYTFGGLSGAYAGYYTVLYLTRWEWQRALICAMLFLIIEVFLATVLLIARVSGLETRLERSESRIEDVRGRLDQTRGARRDRFAWLAPADLNGLGDTQRTFVFVPVLMVAGAVLSGLATVIQKIAGASVGRGAERRLAGRLTGLTAPPTGGTPAWDDRPALPSARPGRRALNAVVTVVGLLIVPLLWSALADATQTRPEPASSAEGTTMVFTVQTLDGDIALAADNLWATCRRSTAAHNNDADLTRVRDGVYVGVIRPALTPHDVMRLRGCIEDANTNRVSAVVLR